MIKRNLIIPYIVFLSGVLALGFLNKVLEPLYIYIESTFPDNFYYIYVVLVLMFLVLSVLLGFGIFEGKKKGKGLVGLPKSA